MNNLVLSSLESLGSSGAEGEAILQAPDGGSSWSPTNGAVASATSSIGSKYRIACSESGPSHAGGILSPMHNTFSNHQKRYDQDISWKTAVCRSRIHKFDINGEPRRLCRAMSIIAVELLDFHNITAPKILPNNINYNVSNRPSTCTQLHYFRKHGVAQMTKTPGMRSSGAIVHSSCLRLTRYL